MINELQSDSSCKEEYEKFTTIFKSSNYDLYNQVQELIQMNDPKVAYFQYNHYLFLNEFNYFFNQLNATLLKSLDAIEYKNGDKQVHYYIRDNKDVEYAKSLCKITKDC